MSDLDQAKIAKIFGSTYEPLNGRSPLQAYMENKSKSAKKPKKTNLRKRNDRR